MSTTAIVSIRPAYLDREQTGAYVSLSDSTMEQMIRAGTFPKPRQLSPKRVGWRVSELDEWCENRPVSDLPPPRNTGVRRGATAGRQGASSGHPAP